MYGQNNRFGNNSSRGNFRGNDRGGDSIAPVKVDELVDLKIEAVGEKGDGIAKKNGFVIFVPNGKEGQTVKVKITRVLKKMAFSEIVGAATSNPSDDSSNEQAAPKEVKEEEKFDSEGDSDDFGEEDQASDEGEWK